MLHLIKHTIMIVRMARAGNATTETVNKQLNETFEDAVEYCAVWLVCDVILLLWSSGVVIVTSSLPTSQYLRRYAKKQNKLCPDCIHVYRSYSIQCIFHSTKNIKPNNSRLHSCCFQYVYSR